MKYSLPFIAIGLAGACSAALATEYGNVVSSTPVLAQVAVPQQQCSDQPALVQPRTSGGGALLGALVGGVVGHNLGEGFGRAAATGLGVVAGSVIGDRTEAANTPPAAVTLRNCQASTGYENRLIGYDVNYDYRGQRYTARLAQDPGARIALNVSVAPADGNLVAAPAQPLAALSPTVGVAAPPVFADAYYGPYAYPGVALAPRVVFGGYRHHGF